MAKSSLPSVDTAPTEKQKQKQVPENIEPMIRTVAGRPGEIVDIGYLSKKVDVKLEGSQPVKFKKIARYLEDNGLRLQNGNFVSNKRRVVQWLIENFELPS